MTEASTETKAETTGGASAATRTYEGGCHCGMVRFAVTTALGPVLACNCSICSKKGHLLTFVKEGQFKLLSGGDSLSDYQFNKKVIHHLFCRVCGIGAFGRGTAPDGTAMYAVNARCLDDVDVSALSVTYYDGKNH